MLVEPGRCPRTTRTSRSPAWQRCPMLVVFGDHRDTPTGLPILPTWQARFEACQALIARVKAAGGEAQMLSPAETRRPRQQPHDHAGQEQPADRRSHPEVDRRARHQATWRCQVKLAVTATARIAYVAVVAAPARRRAAGTCASGAGTGGLCRAPNHGGQHRHEHARATRPRQLPAGRARRPPLLRQRSERAALHPRQADEGVHDVSRFQRADGRPGLFPKFTYATKFRDRARRTSFSIPTTRTTACSTRFTWRTRRLPDLRRRRLAWSPDSI